MTALEAEGKYEVAPSSPIRFYLIMLRLTEDVIGDNLKKPDRLREKGFVPKGFQRDWEKDVEIGGRPMTVVINYSPGTNRPVQDPDISGPAGGTVTDWYADVFLAAGGEPDDGIVLSAKTALTGVLGELFRVTPGKVIEYRLSKKTSV